MQKIKNSFIECFPAVLTAAVVMAVFSRAWSFLEDFAAAHISIHSIVFLLLELIIKAPFAIGLYSFLFGRLAGDKPRIASVFGFYRGARKIGKAFVVNNLTVLLASVLSALFLPIMAVPSDGERMIAGILGFIIILGVGLILNLAPYIYADAPDSDIGDIVIRSVRLGIKYFYIILAAGALIAALGIGYFLLLPRGDIDQGTLTDYLAMNNFSNSFFVMLGGLIFNAAVMWINFTAAYIILEKENKHMLKGFFNKKSNDDIEEEAPFIEPYDFFIEADQRFNDEKTVETENIRGIDILEIFDGMELADNVRVDTVIRKKLKRMFEDLAFEIGEYVTYQGGKEIGDDFTEEIDDREFEVSVKISRASDYEPFKLILSVNISDN